MNKERYDIIINNSRNTLDIGIIDKISKFKYKELDGYKVIEVYVKKNIKAKEMGDILINIEESAKSVGFNVLVDFLRG